MARTATRYFYHSFPHPRKGEDAQLKGLKILECMANVGLVLAPELVEWKQPLTDATERIHTSIQQRISFTEISPRRLKSHAKKFGPFALEFEINDLRRLGAVPVFYIPHQLSEQPGYSAVGMSLVVQLFDAQFTMDKLNELQTISNHAPHSQLPFLDPNINTGFLDQLFVINTDDITRILSFVNYRVAPFDMMRDTLSGVSNLFYPTDNLRHSKLLDYYRQREWRLIGHIAKDGKPLARGLSPIESQQVVDTCSDFWNHNCAKGNVAFKRIDKALVISSFEYRHILNAVRRIIAPEATLNTDDITSLR
jgi:hypothetical protein